MEFRVEQLIAAPPEVVVATYADPSFYEAMGSMPDLGDPTVLSCSEAQPDGSRQLQVRFGFVREVSAAVRAVVDPARLTWVTHATVQPATRSVRFELVPDSYAARLTCSGMYRFEADGGGMTREVVEGSLRMHVPLVGGAVERAILDGFRQHLVAEAELLVEWAMPPP